MAVTLQGFGQFAMVDDTGLSLYGVRPNQFTLTNEITTEDILYYPAGSCTTLQTLATRTTESTWTLEVNSGWFDDLTIPFIFNQRLSPAQPNVVSRKVQTYTVPAAGNAQTVTVTGLTADQPDVYVTVIDNANGDTALTRVATATGAAAATEYDVSADTITLDPGEAQAGKTIQVTYLATETSLDIYGGPATAAPMGTLQFIGKFCPQGTGNIYSIWLKEIEQSEGTAFDSEADSLTFTYTVKTPADWNSPFMIYQ